MTRKVDPSNFPIQDIVDNKNSSTYDQYAEAIRDSVVELRTVIDQAVDAIIGARLSEALLPRDLLLPTGVSDGRFSVPEARFTYSVGSTSVTVGSGRIWVQGRRVDVQGETLTGFNSATNRYIAVDAAGLLFVETSPGLHLFDIATVAQAGATLAADELTDHLGFAGLTPLATADYVNRIPERVDADGTVVGLTEPAVRGVSLDGTLEDAGFTHPGDGPDEFGWVSRRAGGSGSGAGVIAALFAHPGQLLLREQARAIGTGTGSAAGTSGTLAALELDTAVRREPASYIADPWFSAPASTLTKPTSNRYDGTYLFSGFVVFPASAVGPVEADILADGVVVARATSDLATSGETVLPLTGIGEMTGAATVAIRAAHADAAALVVDCRLSLMLIGG